VERTKNEKIQKGKTEETKKVKGKKREENRKNSE
jgi:hypothetical protein